MSPYNLSNGPVLVRASLRSFLILMGIGILSNLGACRSPTTSEQPRVRGHTAVFGGIGHGVSAQRAGRYCTSCHGAQLAGGQDTLTPSCYSCHGQLWESNGTARQPASHTASFGSAGSMGPFKHHPAYEDPLINCTGCHGSDLNGQYSFARETPELARPGCYLCHGDLWTR